MAIEGAIAERARALIPTTWDALATDPKGTGEGPLVAAINTAKEDVLGIIPSTAIEDTFPLIVINHIAKVAVLEIIPSAIDFWMSQSLEETTQGPDETITYTDRAEALRKLREDLLKDVRARANEIASLVGYRRTVGAIPLSNTLREDFITPSPLEFPRPFAPTDRT